MSSEAVSRTTPATAGQHRGEVSARPPRRWRDKFADAFRGLKLGIRGQSSFFVHFFVAAAALAAAWVMALDWVSWCLLLLCIGMVLTAEMFNSALETFCRGLDEPSRNRCARLWILPQGSAFSGEHGNSCRGSNFSGSAGYFAALVLKEPHR
jgi:diacylglycerol kinase